MSNFTTKWLLVNGQQSGNNVRCENCSRQAQSLRLAALQYQNTVCQETFYGESKYVCNACLETLVNNPSGGVHLHVPVWSS